jgi:uncharacterized protein (DUF2267 family)
MEYREFIEKMREQDFIADDQTADALVKAVLGILASGLTHSMAQNLASVLPAPLDYDRLRGHQVKPLSLDSAGYVKNIAAQFDLRQDQARRAVAVILGKARDAVQNNEITIILETILHELEAEELEIGGLPLA